MAGRQAKTTTQTTVATRIAQTTVVAAIPPVFGPGWTVRTSVFVWATSRGAVRRFGERAVQSRVLVLVKW